MSNRNFDSRVIIQRLQNQNYARNLYQTNVNGKTLLTNPQNSDATSSRLTTFVSGAQTDYFRGLLGAGESTSVGGIFGVSATTTTPPSVPSDITITGITAGNQRLTVAFSPPTSDGNSPITDYEYSVNNGATFTSAQTTASPLLITGLTNGTTYQVVLRALNAVGRSESSEMVEGTPSTLPSPPTGLSGAPNDKQIIVLFTAGNNGGSAIVNYQYSTDNGATYRALDPVDTYSPITITKLSSDGTTDLTNGDAYLVRLKAVNNNGASGASSAISVTPVIITEPPAPVDLSGVGGDQTVYILFTQNGDGGSAIINYEYSIDSGSFIACNPAQTFSPVSITTLDGTTRLTNGTSYTITLKVVNAAGPSVASASTTATPTVNSLNTTSLLIELDANNASSYSGSGLAWTNLRSSGSYSATLQNAPTFDNVNKYFTFNGTNQIAEIGTSSTGTVSSPINPTQSNVFTVQIWARINTSSPDFSSFDGLISKQFASSPGGYDGYSLAVTTSGSLFIDVNGNATFSYSSPAGVFNNGWALYTIVVTFTGQNTAYVSTRLVASSIRTSSGIFNNNASIQFPRGIRETSANFCPADVGAFYLYNRAVSQEDIIRNYDATKARYGL